MWACHAQGMKNINLKRRMLDIDVDDKKRGRPKKRCMGYVKDDMGEKRVSTEMTNDRAEKKPVVPTLNSVGYRQEVDDDDDYGGE